MPLSEADLWATGVAFILMAGDVVAGFLAALVKGKVSSTKMRQGLLHKSLVAILILAAAAIQVGAQHTGYDLGIPALIIVDGYVCVMELASIVENVAKGYPAFKETGLYKTLKGAVEDTDAPPKHRKEDQ